MMAWKDGILIEQRTLASYKDEGERNSPNSGSYCLNGVIAVVVPMKARLKWPGEARAHDFFLYRGDDNWLVLKRKELDIIFPWFKSNTVWYRFPPAPPMTETK